MLMDERVYYSSNDERTMATLCHVSSLAMLIIPFGNILGPLVVWLWKKDEYSEVERQGKDVLNFQISMLLYMLISALLIVMVVGILLILALGVANIIVTIIAIIKTSNGERFTYPFAFKILS
jgi:uncharacterized protein